MPGSSVSSSQTLSSLLSDPPGKAFLRIDAEEVVKGDAVTLTCDVGDPGRPEADRFVWMRGRHVVSHVHGRNWTVDPVTLQTKANISCVAVNAVGEGERDSVDVEVFGESEWREWLGTEPKVSIEISHSVANIGGSEATNFNLRLTWTEKIATELKMGIDMSLPK